MTEQVSLDLMVPRRYCGVVRLTIEEGAVVGEAWCTRERLKIASGIEGAKVVAELLEGVVAPEMWERIVIERIDPDNSACKVRVEQRSRD